LVIRFGAQEFEVVVLGINGKLEGAVIDVVWALPSFLRKVLREL
jgi:hypothetical protein